MVNHTQALQAISFYAGNRFDLVQAGGGNNSVKINETEMLVKASGISLSEVTQDKGFVPVDYQLIRRFLATFDFSGLDKKQREAAANKAMTDSKLADVGKPSIETFLHALLNTNTLHTHPISVNVLTAKENWKEELLNIWPDAICVPYHTPGIDLALAMAKEMNKYEAKNGWLPKVIFLQNHGLIISSSDAKEVINLMEEVCTTVEHHIQLDLTRYRNVTALQKLLANLGYPLISMICNDDSVIQNKLASEKQELEIWPFCPDTLIYCGVRPVFLSTRSDQDSIQQYINSYQDYPKVIVLNAQVYFCAQSLKKAKEAQDLFKFHLLVSDQNKGQSQRLMLDEIAYLSNWDAEKYRQGL